MCNCTAITRNYITFQLQKKKYNATYTLGWLWLLLMAPLTMP